MKNGTFHVEWALISSVHSAFWVWHSVTIAILSPSSLASENVIIFQNLRLPRTTVITHFTPHVIQTAVRRAMSVEDIEQQRKEQSQSVIRVFSVDQHRVYMWMNKCFGQLFGCYSDKIVAFPITYRHASMTTTVDSPSHTVKVASSNIQIVNKRRRPQ